MTLTIVPATGELLADWRVVHNNVIPPVQLSTEEVAESAIRNDLTVGWVDGILVGNATVRAAQDGVTTVIVRSLSEHRRHGLGSEYLQAVVNQTRTSWAEQINCRARRQHRRARLRHSPRVRRDGAVRGRRRRLHRPDVARWGSLSAE